MHTQWWPTFYLPPINLYSAPRLYSNMKTDSPCSGQCLYNDKMGCCESCGRTLEDLELWPVITKVERKYRAKQAKNRLKSRG